MSFLKTTYNNTYLTFPFLIIGSIGLFLEKRWKLWMILIFSAIWIIIPHLISQRALWTFEKQITIIICFIAPIIGIGITSIIQKFKSNIIRLTIISSLGLVLSAYWISSFFNAQKFNDIWKNSNEVLSYLAENTKSGDKILAESGGSALLALYEKNYPTNVVTFDWFVYRKKAGEQAYVDAVKDGYFDMIELESLGEQSGTIFSGLHNKINSSLLGNYKKIYTYNGFVIYKRTF